MSDEEHFYGRAPQELQIAVLEAMDKYRDKETVNLESYLQAIWTNCLKFSDSDPPWRELAQVVDAAFESEPKPVPHGWQERRAAPELSDESGWREFEETILFQIADLRRMRGGVLEDQFRCSGAQSPTGHSWYNFDPLSFIECGLAGMSATIEAFQFKSNWGGFQLFLESGQGYE